MPGLSRDATDVRTENNGYKNVLDFIITLVVVNSLNSSSLTQIDTSYSTLVELIVYSLVKSYNSFPHSTSQTISQTTALVYSP